MKIISPRLAALSLAAVVTLTTSPVANAQMTPQAPALNATMSGAPAPKGPEIKGIITARSGDKIQVTAADGSKTVIVVIDSTRIKSGSNSSSAKRNPLTIANLLNGLPVSVKTLQAGESLLADQITFKNNDLKIATMISNGTSQAFAEQNAATEALRGRMADIDQYNIKGTTNVLFDTGKTILSEPAKAELCATAATAESMKNSLLLIIGYTDSVGDEDYNQQLSEKRASRVVNYMQQKCGWKPYRMLTPTGMAKADPLADNSTAEGKAQNRRVAVNILVSKGLDGM
ncbi:OmpA family protein [Sandarakinorhabdus sp.]|uniref:OmpA family protein n=1 Tax=Sandarakinorhabdus sp. TaxID=1916663 RepID=UPI00286E3CB4|nr:OmpA family protein [Sandarakinorhabdus sp.]